MFGSINVVEILQRTAPTEDDILRLLGTKRVARRLSRGRHDLMNEILRVEDKHLTSCGYFICFFTDIISL